MPKRPAPIRDQPDEGGEPATSNAQLRSRAGDASPMLRFVTESAAGKWPEAVAEKHDEILAHFELAGFEPVP
jgi:hypothetical protein